jgi:hypothetical protein
LLASTRRDAHFALSLCTSIDQSINQVVVNYASSADSANQVVAEIKVRPSLV